MVSAYLELLGGLWKAALYRVVSKRQKQRMEEPLQEKQTINARNGQ